MSGPGTLDIVIGMFFIYLLFSLLCSGVNEWIGGLTASRARTLESGIRNMLNDPDGKGLAKDILDDPLIRALRPTPLFSLPSLLAKKWASFGRPQYISAGLFVTALINKVAPLGQDSPPRAFADVWNGLHAGFKEQSDRRAALEAEINDLAADAARLAAEASSMNDPARAQQAREKQALIVTKRAEAEKAKAAAAPFEALLSIVGKAPNDIDSTRKALESWYDESMERVSGWYKRKTQLMLTLIAAVVSVVLNADGVNFLQYLNRDTTARASISAAARDFVQTPTKDQQFAPAAPGGRAPAGGAGGQAGAGEARVLDAEARVRLLHEELRSLSLPIGWNLSNASREGFWKSLLGDQSAPPADPASGPAGTAKRPEAGGAADQSVERMRLLPDSRRAWLLKIAGLVLSTIAMSMGSSFYFDLLKKVVNLRQTGVPPDEIKPARDVT